MRDVVPDDVVPVPVLDDVPEHRLVEITCVLRELFELQGEHQPWPAHHQSLDHELFDVPPEHFLAELAEFRIAVFDRVQFQTESRHADDVRREVSNHLLQFKVIAYLQFLVNDVHQLVDALLDLFVRVPQFSGSESGAELLPHRPPPVAVQQEQAVGHDVDRRVGLEPVVGEVREVAGHDAVDQLRVADHQERRGHLVETTQPFAREPVVNAAEEVYRVFRGQKHLHRVAEQR